MTTPLPELLAQVPTLNDPAEPYTFAVVGDTIVGQWDIVRAVSLYPTEAEAIDRSFTVTVTLDPAKGTYKSKDRSQDSGARAGGGGIAFGTSTFSGTVHKKSFSLTLGGAHATEDGVSPVLAYSFDTARIKEPLFAFLAAHGWTRKRGLFG